MATAARAAHPAAAGEGVDGRDHVVVFPFMAKGHTLPLLHFATALAVHHGGRLRVTLLTTPASLAFARRRLPASVRVVALPFPSHPQLPAGVESTDALPSQSLFPAFLRATALLREPFAEFLASLPSPPLALVSDFFLGFTQRVASDAGVRRLTFHGMSAFSVSLCIALATMGPSATSVEDGVRFHVPGFPESVTITTDDFPDMVAQVANPDDPVTRFMADEVRNWDFRSWGVLVNSFAALDEDYAAILESFYLPGSRAWLVGPLFLAARESPETNEEEYDDDDDPEGCVSWLDERAGRPSSVVYVSFGTQAHVAVAQLDELAHGLVESGHAFLWGVRSEAWSPPVDAGPNGKIVRGWVPQRRVLANPAVGGFVSHCGWNSVLESLAAGLPILAWPIMAEQAANAKHVADIIGAGVRVGVKARTAAVVGRAQVAEKVRELMDSGDEGRRMRASAERVQQAARAAAGEGGTSRLALQRLVDELQASYEGGGRVNSI